MTSFQTVKKNVFFFLSSIAICFTSSTLAQTSATAKITLHIPIHIPSKASSQKHERKPQNSSKINSGNLLTENTEFPEVRNCLSPEYSIIPSELNNGSTDLNSYDSIHSSSYPKKNANKDVYQVFQLNLSNNPKDFTIDHAINAFCQGTSVNVFHSYNVADFRPSAEDSLLNSTKQQQKDQFESQTTILRLAPL